MEMDLLLVILILLDVCLLFTLERLTRDARMSAGLWLLYLLVVGEALVAPLSSAFLGGHHVESHNEQIEYTYSMLVRTVGVDGFLFKPEDFPKIEDHKFPVTEKAKAWPVCKGNYTQLNSSPMSISQGVPYGGQPYVTLSDLERDKSFQRYSVAGAPLNPDSAPNVKKHVSENGELAGKNIGGFIPDDYGSFNTHLPRQVFGSDDFRDLLRKE